MVSCKIAASKLLPRKMRIDVPSLEIEMRHSNGRRAPTTCDAAAVVFRNLVAILVRENERCRRPRFTVSGSALIVDPKSDAAVDGVADRLRAQGAVDEEVGDPAPGDAESEPAAIFEPALVADRRHHGAVAGDGGDDAGMRGK